MVFDLHLQEVLLLCEKMLRLDFTKSTNIIYYSTQNYLNKSYICVKISSVDLLIQCIRCITRFVVNEHAFSSLIKDFCGYIHDCILLFAQIQR